MEKKNYQLFVVCVRAGSGDKKEIIKKGIHAENNFASEKEALEKYWQMVQKDLMGFFDRVVCSVSCSGIRIGIFRFPEKRS